MFRFVAAAAAAMDLPQCNSQSPTPATGEALLVVVCKLLWHGPVPGLAYYMLFDSENMGINCKWPYIGIGLAFCVFDFDGLNLNCIVCM